MWDKNVELAQLLGYIEATVEYIESMTDPCPSPESCGCLECYGRQLLEKYRAKEEE